MRLQQNSLSGDQQTGTMRPASSWYPTRLTRRENLSDLRQDRPLLDGPCAARTPGRGLSPPGRLPPAPPTGQNTPRATRFVAAGRRAAIGTAVERFGGAHVTDEPYSPQSPTDEDRKPRSRYARPRSLVARRPPVRRRPPPRARPLRRPARRRAADPPAVRRHARPGRDLRRRRRPGRRAHRPPPRGARPDRRRGAAPPPPDARAGLA